MDSEVVHEYQATQKEELLHPITIMYTCPNIMLVKVVVVLRWLDECLTFFSDGGGQTVGLRFYPGVRKKLTVLFGSVQES